jgi:hypothetical protein
MSTELVGKVFSYSLPEKKGRNCNIACRLLKDEESFKDRVLELNGCLEVNGPSITGAYSISLDTHDTELSDAEIIQRINSIANEIGFTR